MVETHTGVTDANVVFTFVVETLSLPYCGGGFVEEIDVTPHSSTLDMLRAHRDVERDPTFDLMEAFSAFMRSRLAEKKLRP